MKHHVFGRILALTLLAVLCLAGPLQAEKVIKVGSVDCYLSLIHI